MIIKRDWKVSSRARKEKKSCFIFWDILFGEATYEKKSVRSSLDIHNLKM